ncbi:MAG: ABC transporter substrate-binding protein [Candidatus Jettenia sp. CY-1]|nr:MAG: ABC transporter substrate-binding protein [Candidatus Jettenia sp. CY-1]
MVHKYRNTFRYRKFTVVLWFILSLPCQILYHIPKTIAAENTVLIIRSQSIAAYNEAIKGFEEGCKGKNISIQALYDLKGNLEEGKKVIRDLKENKTKPDLILAVGILAATIVKDQFTDIPIIFCMVINHERFNLQGTNITGISSEASVENQFTVLKEFLGTHKNIGVIYDPMKTEEIISEASRIAKKFEFNLITAQIRSDREVAFALNTMLKKIDALWIIPDGTVITKESLEALLKGAQKQHLPTFCTSSAIVKAGALISVSTDYIHTGIQAAKMAQTLLNSPEVISLGVQQPDKLKLTLNTQTAEKIGIDLASIQMDPDVVFYP